MTTFAFLTLNPGSIILLCIIGMLLFGRKLPDAARGIGKAIHEFKDGFNGIEDHIDTAVATAPRHDPASFEAPKPPQRIAASMPKFEDNVGAITTPPAVQSPAPQV